MIPFGNPGTPRVSVTIVGGKFGVQNGLSPSRSKPHGFPRFLADVPVFWAA
jgi:hypothetical protein